MNEAFSSVVFGVTLLGVVAHGCAYDCTISNTCGGPMSASDSGDADVGHEDAAGDASPDGPVIPPGCDLNAEPKDAPKCVSDDVGVFVDSTASDDNPGTKSSPVKSIAVGIAKLGARGRVYICEGTYAESVKLTSGVSLYGGFACGQWTYKAGSKPIVTGQEGVFALEVSSGASPAVISDMAFKAPDATVAGGSSIGAFVHESSSVTIRRCTLEAGKAADGVDAVAAGAFSPDRAPDGTGGAAGGGATANPACPTSVGGVGGTDAAPNGGNGQMSAVVPYPSTSTGAGATAGAGCLASDGSYGTAGGPGRGAPKSGALDGKGWKGMDGANGGVGGNGQGGGGGGQKVLASGGVGGSGGPGGCGGVGGAKGSAGGSSIALVVFESVVSLEQSTLVAKNAGRGGHGGKGQKAQLGSAQPGAPNNGTKACAGGYGGIGGSGGGGGGGAGGVSAGVLYKGTAPKVDGTSTASADTLPSVTLGPKGAAGTGGEGGDAADTSAPASRAGEHGTDGAVGEAKAVLSAP